LLAARNLDSTNWAGGLFVSKGASNARSWATSLRKRQKEQQRKERQQRKKGQAARA
jgi:hypothetical protein